MSLIQRSIQLAIILILIITNVIYSYPGKFIVPLTMFLFVTIANYTYFYNTNHNQTFIIFLDSNSAIEKCNDTHSDCLKCDVSGLCKKCRKVLIVTTGQCAETCPSGYEYTWSTNDHQMGRVCSTTG